MALILISIIIASFLMTVCVHHFVDGIRTEQKKNALSERTKVIVKHSSTRLQAVIVKDRKELRECHKPRLIKYMYNRMFSQLIQYLYRLLGKDKALYINPQQNLKFNVIRKGNAPNEN